MTRLWCLRWLGRDGKRLPRCWRRGGLCNYQIFWLPLYPSMTARDVDRVVDALAAITGVAV
jgi:dTDP-4-amino-4,6-dideoxygalactose transaminase